ncbi:alpha/beta fold hydrolase [Archangium violaceum]|uniref:alpha/beta hydrolase n=1 Tax=Archangium violaceum TaxID=83451 RepID=UPI0019502273|nr:alpha/beta fold hydrolase [Archangium violaceum]QRN96506.1 alpha/beta fold hydrolase [Archangium violaceum]
MRRPLSLSSVTRVLGLALALSCLGEAHAEFQELLRPESAPPLVEDPGPRSCTSFRYPVALVRGRPAHHEVAAELCVPAEHSRDTVLLTVHGSTYSSLYWDFPYQPERYSFVRHANAAGYATLNIDRIGSRDSDRPLSLAVNLTAQAYVGHQLVQALRNGAFGHAWSRVVLVGHSLGSIISIAQSATYHDVEGLVVTGWLHTLSPRFPLSLPNYIPAALDPRFAGAGLDLGYLTTRPGSRGGMFYHLTNTDPAVLALDEATKETTTELEVVGIPVVGSAAFSLQVDVPVLSVVGRYDKLFCGIPACGDFPSATTLEPLMYSPAAQLSLVTIPASGHDLNLHRNAPTTYAVILDWLDARFAPYRN